MAVVQDKIQNSVDLTKSICRSRLCGVWSLLFLPYLPIGIALCLLRICMSLQAILILLIFPQGTIKRFMLRVFFAVLGIAVTTEGHFRNAKLLISNKLSFIDHIVLHLACDCVSVSSGGHVPPLATLFPHWTFPSEHTEDILTAAKALPEFQETEAVVDFIPYAVQPEPLPTNGQHILLKFSEWPFSLHSAIQPVALSVARPFPPVAVSTVHSSGWWDLIWTLFIPITIFHVRFLSLLEPEESEAASSYTVRVRESLASPLHLQLSQVTKDDVTHWLAAPPHPKVVASGPTIPPSASSEGEGSSSLETMVHQVTAVLPQVPHTLIRKDLLVTNSVDLTISRLLEGESVPVPSHTTERVSMSASQLFRRKVTSSLPRHLSLEERKRELLQSARRKYMEKHGL